MIKAIHVRVQIIIKGHSKRMGNKEINTYTIGRRSISIAAALPGRRDP
jgi:hypothetical protein